MPRRRAGEGRVVNRPEDFFARLVRLPGCRHLTHLGSLFPLTDGQSAPNLYFLKSTLHPKPRPEPPPLIAVHPGASNVLSRSSRPCLCLLRSAPSLLVRPVLRHR